MGRFPISTGEMILCIAGAVVSLIAIVAGLYITRDDLSGNTSKKKKNKKGKGDTDA